MAKFKETLSAEKYHKQKLTAKEGDEGDGDEGEYIDNGDME